MTTYVLVHGAWGGAHGFRHVRRLLTEKGQTVFTPSLTGIGERVHLSSPQVTLTTHVQDVVNHVLYEDLRDIVLLGYSYGGMVVTGSLRYIADRVAHLVYLDAFVPNDGESIDSMNGIDPTRDFVGLGVDDWLVSPTPRTYDENVDVTWQTLRRTRHPLGCFIEGVKLAQPLESFPFTRTFIKATGDPRNGSNHAFWRTADRATSDPEHWRYREIATNHLIPANRPEELSEVLLELA